MLLKVAISVIVVVVCILCFAATRPRRFRIERSVLVAAPEEKIFGLINDFHCWPRWAPQDAEDASMMRTYSGAAHGAGAISKWSGKRSTGSGQMEITESLAPATIKIRTTFVKPFEAQNLNTFTLQPEGPGTRLTWSMEGSNLYFMKLMSLFVNVDRMLGNHFERGLKN